VVPRVGVLGFCQGNKKTIGRRKVVQIGGKGRIRRVAMGSLSGRAGGGLMWHGEVEEDGTRMKKRRCDLEIRFIGCTL